MTLFDLTGKVALVTGATGGIGRDIAKALHAQGATVVLSGTRAEALESLQAELAEIARHASDVLKEHQAANGKGKKKKKPRPTSKYRGVFGAPAW